MRSIVKYQGLENPFANKQIDDTHLQKPSDDKKLEIAHKTGEALGVRVNSKTESAFLASNAFKKPDADKFVKFVPKDDSDPNAKERLVKITTQLSDPLQPPRFKHKRIPRGVPSPPPAVVHSPPRKLTVNDQQNLKIPPCISNWKNAKGHIIPLHMRLMADGRSIQDLAVNQRFNAFSEALYAAERQSREEVNERNRVLTNYDLTQAMQADKELNEAADRAHKEKLKIMASNISSVANTDRIRHTEDISQAIKRDSTEDDLEAAQKERDAIRRQRKYDLRRDQRIEAATKKKAKINRDDNRDIGEKIALGVAQPTSKETMYDQRLFNQSAGLDSGFGDEEDYNLYSKPLFTDRTDAALHKIKESKEENPMDEKVRKMIGKKPTKAFEGAEKNEGGNSAVEFEKKEIPLFGGKEKTLKGDE